MRSYVIFGLLLIVAVEAKYEFTQTAKNCVAEVKTDENAIRALVKEDDPLPEDNELVQQFFQCIFRNYINDSNELVLSADLRNYVNSIFAVRMNGKRKLAALVAEDCLEHCKNRKGDTKGKTAVSVMNCLKKRFEQYVNE